MAVEKIISFILAGIFACISLCQFMEKGILLNNAFIFASKEERKNLDKKNITDNQQLCFICSVQYFS